MTREELTDILARAAKTSRAAEYLASAGVADIENHPMMLATMSDPLDQNAQASAYSVLGWIEAAGFKVVRV